MENIKLNIQSMQKILVFTVLYKQSSIIFIIIPFFVLIAIILALYLTYRLENII